MEDALKTIDCAQKYPNKVINDSLDTAAEELKEIVIDLYK
jgi:guanylate kinase